MLLALDLGNTSLSGALFDGRRLLRRFRVLISEFAGLSARLKEVLGEFSAGDIERVGLASVNPPWAYAVQRSLLEVLGREALVIGRDLYVPIRADVDNPDEVGVDRLLAALGAFRRTEDACLVADFGTALTVDVVSAEGSYLGGVIAAGVGMSAKALHERTALLPAVKLAPVEHVLGTNTVSCIQSGLFWGTISMLEGLVARLRTEHPEVKKVLATGSDAEVFAARCRVIDEVVPGLTLEGIVWTLEGEARK